MLQRLQRLLVLVSLAVASLSASTASGQAFADRAPANVIMFAGWAGTTDHLDYRNSYLQVLSRNSDLPARLETAALGLVPLLQTWDPKAQEHMRLALTLGARVWQKPCGLWVLPSRPGVWQTVFVCEAGNDAALITQEMEPLVQLLSVRGWSPNLTRNGGTLMLTLNLPNGVAPLAPNRERSLAAQPNFRHLVQFLRCNGGLVYVNVPAAMNQLISDVQTTDPAQAARLREFFNASGLGSVRQAGISLLHEALCWNVDMYADAPGARSGLVALMAPRPVQKTTLALVPLEATWFSARTLDLRAMLSEGRRLRAVLQPRANDPIRTLFREASAGGADLETSLLEGLGDQWVVYTDPTIVGDDGLGFVLINPLRNEQQMKRALAQAAQALNARWAQEPDSILRIETVDEAGMQIHTLPLPSLGSPSWAVHNGQLFVALNPQTVSTVALPGPPVQSIMESHHFKMIQIQLRAEGSPWHSVTYAHLPHSMAKGHKTLTQATDWINTKLGAAPGQKLFEPPPPSAFKDSLRPSGSVGWSDRNGCYSKSVTPFPGSSLITPPVGFITVKNAMLVTALGPRLFAGGEIGSAGSETQAATHLRGLGMAMLHYADQHQRYPASAGELVDNRLLTGEAAISPFANIKLADGFSAWTPGKKGMWIEEHGSFVILRWGEEPTYRPTQILGYMKPSHSPTPGKTLLLYADNRTEPLDTAAAAEALREQFPTHRMMD